MPEPITVAAGVGSLLTSTYTLSKTLYQSIDSIRQAPKHLILVSHDLKAFYSILGTLHVYMQEEDTIAGVLHPTVRQDLDGVLTQCVSIFQHIGEFIAEFLRNDATSTVSKWRAMRYSWKENEIAQLKEHLMAHKLTLSLDLCSANLINTRTSHSTHQSVETELKELRLSLTDMFVRFKQAEERYDERGVELSNLQFSFNQFTERDGCFQPSTSVRTPESATMVLSTATGIDNSSTYFSLTSSLLESGSSRPDYETAYEDFVSLLSGLTIGTVKTATTYRTACANSQTSFETSARHGAHNIPGCDFHSRQVFVQGLVSRKTLVVDLQCLNIADDLYRYLEKETGISQEKFQLTMHGRKLPATMLAKDMPGKSTITATARPSEEYEYSLMSYVLERRNQYFLICSCDKVHQMLTREGKVLNSWTLPGMNANRSVLFDLLDHYLMDNCQICADHCKMTVEEEIKEKAKKLGYEKEEGNQAKSGRPVHTFTVQWPSTHRQPEVWSLRSWEQEPSVKRSAKRRTLRSVFRYQGLALYEN